MKTHRILSCIIPAALVFAAAGTTAPTRRLGLMIGANDGGPARVRLQYAGSDAKSFARSMEELGGLEPRDRILLKDPDSAGLAMALDLLAAQAREAKRGEGRVEAVIYYSGHADEYGLLLKGERFGFRDFRSKVDLVPADVRIAVVDACASGALTRLKGGRALPAFLSDKSSQTTGYAFLTSSSADEAAQESDRIGASFFSHYLNTGLRGAADASQDGRVTLHEAYQYAYHETLARTENTSGGPQHAGYDMRLAGSGDVVMTELSRAEATLALPDSVHGRFFIRDSRDRLVAEVQKPAGRPLRIALEPGAYQARWHHSRGIRERSFVLEKGAEMDLLPGPMWREVSREASVARGSPSPADTARNEDWSRDLERRFQFHLIGNQAREDFRGTQLSLIYNQAKGRLDGQQLTVALNMAESEFFGVQASMAVNYAADQVRGGQISSGFNLARRDLQGVQIASAFNYLGGAAHGIQAAGGFNYAASMTSGVQAATFFNLLGGNGRGAQAAFFGNFASGSLSGLQMGGLLNVAGGAMEGYQIGLINIAGSYRKGAPIGVFNYVGDGVWRADTWADETGFTHVGLVSGSRHVNTRLALGGKPLSDRSLGAGTLEVAGHLPLQPAFLELGVMASVIGVDGGAESRDDMPDFLQRLRLSAGVDLGRYVSLAGGVSWALLVSPEDRRPYTDGNWMQHSSFDDRIHQWPGAHLSLRLGVQ